MALKYLLSIDGGGIRGIIPVTALAKLEATTGRPARETFSFVAGTSTGAIIAGGLAAGIPASRLLELYTNNAYEVFPQSILNLPKRVLTGAMYPPQALHDVIARELGPAAGWALNDSPIDLMITAKRVSDGAMWYFVRDNPLNSGRTGRLKLADCVTASAAAPTYFYPWTIAETPPDPIPPGWKPVGTLVDGGVGVAGNPVYQACVEAFYYSDQYNPADTVVVSLGTGRFLGDQNNPGWIWPWLGWILRELLRSPNEQQTELVQRHFTDTPFFRLDIALDRDIEMDDIHAIPELREYGERLADTIDWNAILDESDTDFRMGAHKTKPGQYAVRVR